MPAPPGKHQIRRVVSMAYETPWGITPEKLQAIAELLDRRHDGHLSAEEIEARLGDAPRRRVILEEAADTPYQITPGGVAIIPLYGTLAPRMNLVVDYSGGTSTQEFAAAVQEAAADPDVKAIVLDVDSPGGMVLGTPEAAQQIELVAKTKPVITVATGQICSCAYWIGAAAGRIVVSPSTMAGSIGVLQLHSDYSAADTMAGVRRTVIHAGSLKGIGNPYETLDQNKREAVRVSTDDYYAMFVEAVARYRKITVGQVEDNFGQGEAMVASRALAAGLVDRIGTLSEIVAELESKPAGQTAKSQAGGGSFPGLPLRGQSQQATSLSKGEVDMDPETKKALVALGLCAADADEATAQAALAGVKSPPKQVAKTEPAPAAAPVLPTPAAALLSPGDRDAAAAKAATDERERARQIRARGQILGCDAAAIDAAIDAGHSVDRFLREATEAGAKRDGPVHPVERIEAGPAAKDKWQAVAIDALFHKSGVPTKTQPKPEAKNLCRGRAMDVVRETLRIQYGRALVGSDEDLAAAALGNLETLHALGADVPYSTPGDFPNILAGLGNRVLEETPRYAETSFQNWTWRRPSVPDFRPATILRIGEFGEFPEHIDGHNFEQSKPLEEYSWIQVDSYGDEFSITPVMIANDDLGAFPQAIQDKDAAHDATLNRLCVNLLTGNPTLGDGYALFNDTYHFNDIDASASSGAPSVTDLALIRLRLRRQKGPTGKRKINQSLVGLLIPEDLETVTEQLLDPQRVAVPITDVTVNTFRGRVAWWIDPQLADWSLVFYFGFANPQRSKSIVHCYQTGYERMQMRSYFNPKSNCRVWQFEGRFAAGINSWRGVVRDAGT